SPSTPHTFGSGPNVREIIAARVSVVDHVDPVMIAFFELSLTCYSRKRADQHNLVALHATPWEVLHRIFSITTCSNFAITRTLHQAHVLDATQTIGNQNFD